jgi:hypothetical protein
MCVYKYYAREVWIFLWYLCYLFYFIDLSGISLDPNLSCVFVVQQRIGYSCVVEQLVSTHAYVRNWNWYMHLVSTWMFLYKVAGFMTMWVLMWAMLCKNSKLALQVFLRLQVSSWCYNHRLRALLLTILALNSFLLFWFPMLWHFIVLRFDVSF